MEIAMSKDTIFIIVLTLSIIVSAFSIGLRLSDISRGCSVKIISPLPDDFPRAIEEGSAS